MLGCGDWGCGVGDWVRAKNANRNCCFKEQHVAHSQSMVWLPEPHYGWSLLDCCPNKADSRQNQGDTQGRQNDEPLFVHSLYAFTVLLASLMGYPPNRQFLLG
jgi:hypothetical protein